MKDKIGAIMFIQMSRKPKWLQWLTSAKGYLVCFSGAAPARAEFINPSMIRSIYIVEVEERFHVLCEGDAPNPTCIGVFVSQDQASLAVHRLIALLAQQHRKHLWRSWAGYGCVTLFVALIGLGLGPPARTPGTSAMAESHGAATLLPSNSAQQAGPAIGATGHIDIPVEIVNALK